MQTRTAALNIDQRKMVITMGVLIGVLALSYVFLVNKTVRNVVERRALEADNGILASQVSELEFTYMRQKNVITPEEALETGFSEAQKVTYIPRTPEGAVLTLNR